jgi:hypothetical protein
MPISTAQFTLATGVRQKIVEPDVMSQHVCIHNHEHSLNKEIFIGNSTVTTTTGIHAVATQTSLITIGPGDDLWAISGENGTVALHVLIVKQD